LTRLAVRGNTRISIPAKRSFRPNDRVLGRYAGKFAALPDGLPFSIRLLLEDGQGRRKAEGAFASRTFNQLPAALQLQALPLALQREAEARPAKDDDGLADLLVAALKGLGLEVDNPAYRHVIGLREKLKYHGLGHLFPNAATRQERYGCSPPSPAATEELP